MSKSQIFLINQHLSSKQVMQDLMQTCECQIFYEHPNEQALGYGSGYLVSKGLILTPAHNIYDPIRKILHKNISVVCHFGSRTKKIDCHQQNIFVSQKFIQQEHQKHLLYDYALIKLDQQISDMYEGNKSNIMSSNMVQQYCKITANNLKEKEREILAYKKEQERIILEKDAIIQKLKTQIEQLQQQLINDSFTSIKSNQYNLQQQKQKANGNQLDCSKGGEKWAVGSLYIQGNRIKQLAQCQGKYEKIVSISPLETLQTITFKVIKYRNNSTIIMGLVPQDKINQKYSTNNKQTVQLWVDSQDGDGWIYANGIKVKDKNDKYFVPLNTSVEIKILAQTIQFKFQNGNKAKLNLDNNLSKQKWHAFVALSGKGDEVQVIYND